MQWSSGNQGDIDDQRGQSGGGGGFGVAHLGIGGFLILLVLSWVSGTNLFSLLDTGSQAPSQTIGNGGPVESTPAEDRAKDMVGAVAKDAQDMWSEMLGSRYQRTKIRLFRDSIQSACGFAQSATGPFYCPGDEIVYLDLGFFNELRQRFGASGDFAEAYVIAHEVGHHVQNLLGIDAQMRRLQSQNPGAENQLSVRLELQADCLAGVWAHATNKVGRGDKGLMELEPGDLEEGLRAAAAIGDDRIQRMQTGHVFPDKFTHGTAEQRVTWLRRGFDQGDPNACQTFQ